MRVHTFHRKRTRRSSTALGILLTMHLFFSLPLTAVLLFYQLSLRWRRDMLSLPERAGGAVILGLWLVTEMARLWLGFAGNHFMRIPEFVAFTVLNVVPQVVLMVIYLVITVLLTDVEVALAICQIVLLVLECAVAVRHLTRLGRHSTVDFFVGNGFVLTAEQQRAAAAAAVAAGGGGFLAGAPEPSASFAGALMSVRH